MLSVWSYGRWKQKDWKVTQPFTFSNWATSTCAAKKHNFSISLLDCKVINKKAWLALQMIQLTFAFKTGTNQPPLTNNRDVNSFIIAKAQIDANLWKLWHSSIDLGPGFRSFFVQEALVSYCSIWLMDLFCSHSVYCIASLPKLENNGRKGPNKFRLFWFQIVCSFFS